MSLLHRLEIEFMFLFSLKIFVFLVELFNLVAINDTFASIFLKICFFISERVHTGK